MYWSRKINSLQVTELINIPCSSITYSTNQSENYNFSSNDFTSGANSTSNFRRNCLFCGNDHSSFTFTCNISRADNRIAKARELNVCHNCLKPRPFSKDIRFNSNCTCGIGKHCRALCLHGENNTIRSNNN